MASSDPGLKALRLWIQITFAFLNLFMSETFHTEESLSNQIYLAELPLSAMSALTSAVCKVVGPKGRMSLWREWCSRGFEDEADPWLFWVLLQWISSEQQQL